MLTYTGRDVTPEEGCPGLVDIAMHLSRSARYAGATSQFYSVLPHCIVVGALAHDEAMRAGNVDPERMKVLGYLHDAAEAIVSDVPHPWKAESDRRREDLLQERIYQNLGIEPPMHHEAKAVKRADMRALHAEGWLIGPKGWREHHDDYPEPDQLALDLTAQMVRLDPASWIDWNVVCDKFVATVETYRARYETA